MVERQEGRADRAHHLEQGQRRPENGTRASGGLRIFPDRSDLDQSERIATRNAIGGMVPKTMVAAIGHSNSASASWTALRGCRGITPRTGYAARQLAAAAGPFANHPCRWI